MDKTAKVIEELESKCARQEQQIAELTAKLTWFEEQFRLSQKKRFGSSSEQTDQTDQVQLQIFNEAEREAKPSAPEPTFEEITYKRQKRTGNREEKLKDLPVKRIEYHLSPEEQICDCCGGKLHEMSNEVRKEVEFIPAQINVVEHVRYVYSCRRCEREEVDNSPIVTAPMPAPPIPGSLASPSAIAYVMAQKYVEGMPLYRQEKALARQGVELSRQTLANWVIQGSDRWLIPLYERMHQHLVNQDILFADETTLQVLREAERAPTSQSYLWLFRTGRAGPPIVLYDYQTTRANKHPARFLEKFNGYLHVDGYAGYNGLKGVTLVGCWSHSRRKFDEALKALPAGQSNASVAAKEGLAFCNKLFDIEKGLKDVKDEERYKLRLERSRPVLDAFSDWLNYQRPRVLPKSAFGQAIAYCRNQWSKLEAFLQDGRLELDNNRSERSIKPFVIGRKNWLFCNTPRGAKASATVYSIVESAKENGLNPFTYLKFLFEKLPNIDVKDQNALDDLLPWSDKLPAECRVKSTE